MTISSADLLDALKNFHLLDNAKVEAIARQVQGKVVAPQVLAQTLLDKKLLTSYQVDHLLQGRAQELLLGAYVLLDQLGQGGMGEVFRARHWKMNRIVALKLIRKESLVNEDAVKRFQREARAAAQLDHPNVVHAFDADKVGATHIFVMEYVEGIDLGKLVDDRGPLGIAEACEYMRQAALGLQHAHEHGLVHRDIKPHNLLLASPRPGSASTGTIKILDFGLALLASSADGTSGSVTQSGYVMGTPDYISPEQAREFHSADIRSDLYSLGCTFYFLLTAQVPFPRGSPTERMLKHLLDEPTPIEQLRPEVPPGVAAVVRKLMRKEPHDRLQTPAELATLLAHGPALAVNAIQTLPRPTAPPAPAPHNVPREPALGAAKTVAWAVPQAASKPAPKKSRMLYWGAGCALVGGLAVLGVGLALVLLPGNTSSKAQVAASTKTTPAAQHEKLFENSIGMKFVWIPPGKFKMGSTATDIERLQREPHAWHPPGWDQAEQPQHEVSITKGFYLSVYEVKQGQYTQVTGRNPSSNKASPDHPVENVTWTESDDFCKKLAARRDETQASRVYRLPTEAEWEYACRAGKQSYFHWGNAFSSRQANFKGTAPFGGASQGPNVGTTVACGSFAANAWGLHDMHGNVWEWCQDGPRAYTPNPVENPQGPGGVGSPRMLRGGSWLDEGWLCRSALRNPFQPGTRYAHVGFRVVLER